MDRLQLLERIKTAAILGIFSDDRLLEELVLKGGNALDIAYGASTRASVDLDFSMGDDFLDTPEEFRVLIETGLRKSFRDLNLVVFDVTLDEVPAGMTDELKQFWGGYSVHFKIIKAEDFAKHGGRTEILGPRALPVGERNSTKFKIDISKHEYREGKIERELEGLTICVYSPAMIVCEKLRAICQQMPDYGPIVKRTRKGSARARDFVDIHGVCERFEIDFSSNDFQRLLSSTFAIKRVPLAFIGGICKEREFHRTDFSSVQATVKASVELQDFDFYFDFLVERCKSLEVLWKEDLPS